jgi:Flp pilus assembly protein TadG
MFPRLASFARDASGAVAPLFAVGLIAFVGVGALAWDISRGYALRAELEAAVDAAALAGATQLDGKTGSIARANAAALGALVQNSSILADAYQANTVGAGDTIQYLTNLTEARTGTPDDTGVALTVTDSKANFIEITLAPRPMGLVLGALLGLTTFNARAHAVAGYGSAICKVPPLVVCNPEETALIKTFSPDDHIGKGFILKSKPGATWGPGNFGYLSVTGEDGIKEAMGHVTPQTQCFGEIVETQPGNIAAADQFFNTRFDYYAGSANGKKSDAEYMPSQNTITGRGNNCTADLPVYTQCGGADPTSMALPRDCCGYSGGTCEGPDTNPMGDGDWERDKYLRVNHDGATFPSDWSVYGPTPVAGVAEPTRYQVYSWENEAINAKLENGTAYPSNMFRNTANDNEAKTCYTGTTPVRQTTPDRRTISVLVANCMGKAMTGSTELSPVAYLDLFLTEPVDLSGTGVNQRLSIYGEIIGETSDASTVGEETRYYTVRLYE